MPRVPEVEMIDWDMSPEAITICQAPDGSDRLWELGRYMNFDSVIWLRMQGLRLQGHCCTLPCLPPSPVVLFCHACWRAACPCCCYLELWSWSGPAV